MSSIINRLYIHFIHRCLKARAFHTSESCLVASETVSRSILFFSLSRGREKSICIPPLLLQHQLYLHSDPKEGRHLWIFLYLCSFMKFAGLGNATVILISWPWVKKYFNNLPLCGYSYCFLQYYCFFHNCLSLCLREGHIL